MRKKLLAALLAVCMVVTLLPATVLAASFNDTDGHWAASAIERWTKAGVVSGKGDGMFDPDGGLTRAEFATILVNLMGYTKTSDKTFTDVSADAWYADAISKVVAAGVMNGVGDGAMDPDGIVTRSEVAVMLCRAFNIKPSGESTMTFDDSAEVEDWAKDAMTALTERGMMNGTGDNKLSPNLMIDRASVMKLADTMVPVYVTSEGGVSVSEDSKVEVTVAENGAVTIKSDVKGIVLAAKGADVAIEGASVDTVVAVSAKVTADESSKVGDVVVGGEKPAVDIKGEVTGTVEVATGTEGQTVEVPAETPVVDNSDATEEEEKKDDEETTIKNPAAAAAHVHDYKLDKEHSTPATCKDPGTNVYVCKDCPLGGKGTYNETVPKLEHKFSTTAVEGEYPCTNRWTVTVDGEETTVGCGETTTVDPATHDCTKIELPDATDAGKKITVTTTAATCAVDGKKVWTCDVCNKVLKTEVIKKSTVGHSTPTAAEIDAGANTFDDLKLLNKTNATCQTTGLTNGYQCKTCGKIIVAQKVTAKGSVEGSHYNGGAKIFEGEKVERLAKGTAVNLNAAGDGPHDCTKPAHKADELCAYCNAVVNPGEVVLAADAVKEHNFNVEVGAEPATCKKDGHEAGTQCANCEIYKDGGGKSIPKDGAKYHASLLEDVETALSAEKVEAIKLVAPTCTKAGSDVGYKCATCGSTIKAGASIPALGHSYKVDPDGEEPTTEADGYYEYRCVRYDACHSAVGHTVLPKLGQDEVFDPEDIPQRENVHNCTKWETPVKTDDGASCTAQCTEADNETYSDHTTLTKTVQHQSGVPCTQCGKTYVKNAETGVWTEQKDDGGGAGGGTGDEEKPVNPNPGGGTGDKEPDPNTPSTPEHKHVLIWAKDNEKHWKKCKENDGYKEGEEAHNWETTEDKKSVCTVCAFECQHAGTPNCKYCGVTR